MCTRPRIHSGHGAGQTLCNGACINAQTDPFNCDICGQLCPSAQACQAGFEGKIGDEAYRKTEELADPPERFGGVRAESEAGDAADAAKVQLLRW